jgi:uncharacterized protein (TIGR01777 family)
MKVVLAGGSGQVGMILSRAFRHNGHDVVVLSRRPDAAHGKVVRWNARTLSSWTQELEGAEVVINLAGRSVNCRYNTQNRQEIMQSRVDSTRAVGEAIAKATHPPRVWLQASTATIYAHRYDAPNDEFTGIIGGSEPDVPDTWRFSISVAQAWERAVADTGTLPHTRTVLLRSAMTMSPDQGGVFDVLSGLVRMGLGGRAGDGRQYVSWIHEADFVRAVYWLIEQESLSGPVNLAAPNPLPNAEFMRDFRQAWGVSIGFPTTKWMLEIGAVFLRTETELILKSRRVVPTKLTQSGFIFQFPKWLDAAQDLRARWRAQGGNSHYATGLS